MKYLAIALLIVAAFVGGYFFSQKYNFRLEPKNSTVVISPTISGPMVGNDRDAHGCIISAGYSWCEEKQKCLKAWEEPCSGVTVSPSVDETATIIASIKQQLVAEHGPTANSLVVGVSRVEGNFAKGGATETGGGAMWFAAKVNGQWMLVYDGNGIITCDALKNYQDFPASFIPECFDASTSSTVQR